jgi:CubicO group peptidase (beta-lactamase class C family)
MQTTPLSSILLFCLMLFSCSQARSAEAAAPQATAASAPSRTGDPAKAERIERFMRDRMPAFRVPGASLAIIEDGQVVYHRVFGMADNEKAVPVTASTLFEGASLSKPLFGYFVMSFVEEGRLDLDRPLHEYLPHPDLTHDPRHRAITARMVLSHTSGLPNWRSGPGTQGLAIHFEPGSGFKYSGEGYQYLALVLAHIAGTDPAGLEALFQARVAKPLGMTHTHFVRPQAESLIKATPYLDGKPLPQAPVKPEFGAAYSIETEAQDYARWMVALLDARGLSEPAFATYFAGQQAKIPEDEPERAFGLQDWALGLAILETPFGRLYAHGGNNEGFTSLMVLSRERKWGMVLFTNADQVTPLGIELMAFLQGGSE